MTGNLHDRLEALARHATASPLDLQRVQAEARRRKRRRLAAAVPALALLAAVPLGALAVTDGGADRLVEQPADGAPRAVAARLCEQAAADYDGVVVEAEETTVGAVRAQVPAGLAFPDGWPGKSSGDPAARCTVDGRFPVSRPAGAPPATRGVVVAADGAAPLLLSAGPADSAEARAPSTAPTAAAAPSGATRTITLTFVNSNVDTDCAAVIAVQREIPQTEQVLTAALRELFSGPKPSEAAQGAAGFGPETAGLLRSARVLDGIAYLDLNAAVLPGNYSTSCGSSALLAMIRGTVTQFPTVRDFRAALDGDPRAFVAFLEGACPEPATPGDECDPRPFQ